MVEQQTAGERRKSDRVPVEMWVQESRGGRELYFQRAANLSRGGMYLENTIPHPFGTEVELEFTIPGQTRPVRLQGKIVNVASGTGDLGMGVEFLAIDPETARVLDEYIEREGRAG